MFSNLEKALNLVSNRIALFEDRQSIVDYLDSLESRIVDVPYGDLIYEHAYEIAQVKIQSIKGA